MQPVAYAQAWQFMADFVCGNLGAMDEMCRVRQRLGPLAAGIMPLEHAVRNSGLPAKFSAISLECLPVDDSCCDPDLVAAWAIQRAHEASHAAAAHRNAIPIADRDADPVIRACKLLWPRLSAIRGGLAAYQAALAKGIVFGEQSLAGLGGKDFLDVSSQINCCFVGACRFFAGTRCLLALPPQPHV